MLTKPYGGAFTFNYYPLLDGDAFDPPAQTPSIYVFDSKPDINAIDNGTNAIGVEITTWGEGTANIRTITIPAIADDGDTAKSEVYYLGLKYIAVASGSATYDIIPFKLTRPDGAFADPTPTATEVKAVDVELVTFFTTDTPIDNQVTASENKLREWYAANNVEWQNIHNPDKLKNVIIYYTIANLYLGRRRAEGDLFDLKYQEYIDLYRMMRNRLKLEYDANSDDEITEQEETKTLTRVAFTR